HLLLSPGEFGAGLRRPVLQGGKDRKDFVEAPGFVRDHGREKQVFQHGERAVDAAVVLDPPDPHPGDLLGGKVADLATIQQDPAPFLPVDAHDASERRRLAHAVAADEGDDPAVPDLEGDAVEDLALPVPRLEAGDGRVVTLVGRNGMGKTTALRCIMGIHRQKRGRILLDGREIGHLPPQQIARMGIGWVQDDRGIYGTLSVLENLLLPPVVSDESWSLDKVYSVFPPLKDRASQSGSKLSGGEQQMLAIARVLRMGAKILLLDEPTEGLAPLLVERVGEIVKEIKSHGLTVLLVEQNLRFATTVADTHHLIVNGRTVRSLSNQEVVREERELLEYLGV